MTTWIEVPERLLRPSRGVRAAGYKNSSATALFTSLKTCPACIEAKLCGMMPSTDLPSDLKGVAARQGSDAAERLLRFPAKINGMRHHRPLFIT